MSTDVSHGTALENLAALAQPPPPLAAMNFSFTKARVLGTALDLDLFTSLSICPANVGALAETLDCDPEALGRLLAVLVDLELLEQDPVGAYAPTALSRRHLVAGTAEFLGPHFDDVLGQWDRWAGLTEVVRTGARSGRLGEPGVRDRHSGMFGGGFPLAIGMVDRITAGLSVPMGARIFNDQAGGGEWAISLAARHPDVQITVRDTPRLLAGIRERARQIGVDDRFTCVTADSGLPPAGFQLVVLAQAGRFAGPEALAGLVARAAEQLSPDGVFVLADVMAPEPGSAAGPRPMLDLSLFVNTRNGRLLSRAENAAVLARTGLTVRSTAEAGLLTALIAKR